MTVGSSCKSVKPCWVVFLIIIFGISACSKEKDPQTTRKYYLGLKDATISIVGDDSFVKSRFYRNYLYHDYEVLTFHRGFLSYGKAHPGYALAASLYGNSEVVEDFNRFKAAKQRAMSVSEDDVQIRTNIYGTYSVVSKGSRSDGCLRALQYFGPANSPNSPGNQRVRVGACWGPGKGGKERLEAFVYDLMSRVRFDDGAINRAKAGSAK